MEPYDYKEILAIVSKYQNLLVALTTVLVALFCVYIGHRLTLSMHNKRAGALELGLNNEILLVKEYFQTWLKDLIDEFENPVRSSYSGFNGVDMSCIDSLMVELISVNRLLTKDQRGLIINLKSKVNGILKKDCQRNEATKEYEQKDRFYVPTPATAHLIAEAVEVVSFLTRYIESGKKFSLENNTSWEDHAQLAFSEAHIEYTPELWGRIYVAQSPTNTLP